MGILTPKNTPRKVESLPSIINRPIRWYGSAPLGIYGEAPPRLEGVPDIDKSVEVLEHENSQYLDEVIRLEEEIAELKIRKRILAERESLFDRMTNLNQQKEELLKGILAQTKVSTPSHAANETHSFGYDAWAEGVD
jgi:hypothetical protein